MQGGECVMFPFEKDTEELEEEEEIEYYPKEYDIDFSSGKLNGKIAEGARALAVWAYFTIKIKNSIFRNSLIFQGLPPIKYQNLMYFPLFLPL